MKNISMKVAVGYALPCGPGEVWHGRKIQAGYARVGVCNCTKYASLEIDIPGPEEERTLGEVLGSIILWDKKHIVFLGSVPRRPPSPPSPRNSTPPSSPPHDYDHHSPSLSPPVGQPSSPPPASTKVPD
jgi:hypothetical protein